MDENGPYTPNGITTVFPFTFEALSSLGVTPVQRDELGNDTPMTGFTVELTATGGSVVFATAPAASGDPIYITSGAAFLQTPTAFLDNGEATDLGTHIQTSTFARVAYYTESSQLTVTAWNNSYASFPWAAEIGLYVDGEYQALQFGSTGTHSVTVNLGNQQLRKIELVNGAQSAGGVGIFLVSAQGDQPLIPIDDSKGSLLLFYGDSIGAGERAIFPTGMSFPMLVRQQASVSVGAEAYGSRSLNSDAVNSTVRAAFVQKIVGWNPSTMWLAIGTNDYGLAPWSAASFGTAYAALLDDLHAALPNLQIYAQTPFPRTTETANSFGSTLGDYRTQIANAAAARSSFVTLIDGTTIITTADLSGDGLHPTTAGHAKIGAYINNLFHFQGTPVAPNEIINLANTTVTQPFTGTYRVTKTAGGAAFNASAYGVVPLDGDFTLKVAPSQFVLDAMAGVSPNPGENSDEQGVAYAAYLSGNGFIHAFAKGEEVGVSTVNYSDLRPGWVVREGGVLTIRSGNDVDTAEIIGTFETDARLYVDTSLSTQGQYLDLTLTVPEEAPEQALSLMSSSSSANAALESQANAASALASKNAAKDAETAAENAAAAAAASASLVALGKAATRSALAASDTAKAMYLYELGREGQWVFDTSDLSAKVTVDTAQAIYVPPSASTGLATNGSQGAWVRKFSGPVNALWAGLIEGDNPANGAANSSAFSAMQAVLASREVNAVTNNHSFERVLFPYGIYWFASTIEIAGGALILEGHSPAFNRSGAILKFPAGVCGIRVQNEQSSGASTKDAAPHASAQGTTLRNLTLYGSFATTEAEAHGVVARTTITCEQVRCMNFEGDGFLLSASSGAANGADPPYGNANGSELINCTSNGNRRGLAFKGTDASACKITNFNGQSNRWIGAYNGNLLNNSYDGGQFASNGMTASNDGVTIPVSWVSDGTNRFGVILGQEAGASVNAPPATPTDNQWWYFITAGAASAASGCPLWFNGIACRAGGAIISDTLTAHHGFSGVYAENSGPKSQILQRSLVMSGELSSWIYNNPAANRGTAVLRGGNNGAVECDTCFTANSGTVTAKLGLASGNSNNVGLFLSEATLAPSGYNLRFHSSGDMRLDYGLSDGSVPFWITGPNTAIVFGTSAAIPNVFYPPSLALGTSRANARLLTIDNVVPSTGAHGAGEFVHSRAAAAGLFGWRCTVAGTPGTWEECWTGYGTTQIGYKTGAGGAVAQATNKSTGVTLNKLSGAITMNGAALAAGALATFTVTNSQVAATDTINLNLQGGQVTAGTYRYWVEKVAAGSFQVTVENRSAGSLSEALVFNFAVVKAVAS